jgi:hypothetical protein
MAGKRVEVHVTLTNELSKILSANQNIHLAGDCDFLTALNIATLTLKHRQNKNQKQRIIMFVGSPIRHSVEEMVQVGKKLKKYNIAVDVVSFGNLDENRGHLNQFLKAVNNANNSSLTEVPVGDYIVDNLFSSPIMSELGAFGDIPMEGEGLGQPVPSNVPSTSQQGVGMSQFERDIDMAIQNSLLEEQRRQEALNAAKNNVITEVKTSEINQNDKNVEMKAVEEEEDEEAALEQAKLLSMKEHEEVLKKESDEEKKVKDELLENQEFIKDLLQGINSTEIKDDEIEEMMKNIKDNKKNDDKDKDNQK